MIIDMINDRLLNCRGKIGIEYIDIESGERISCGNCRIFPASGAVKLPALIECHRAVCEGRLSWEDLYNLNTDDYTIDAEPTYGVLNYMHAGIALTVRDLCNLMITVSDNSAFNIICDIVGMDNINKMLKQYGYINTIINRKLLDMEKIAGGVENYVSVEEMATIFLRLYQGQMVNVESSRDMLELLKLHQRTNIMPYYFPEKMPMAHLSAFDENVLIDMGIIYGQGDDRPFILVMAASDIDVRKAETLLRDITLICYKGTEAGGKSRF